MPKLSPNQAAAVGVLRTLQREKSVEMVDKNAWKAACREAEATLSLQSLVNASAVVVHRAQVGARTIELFSAQPETAEVGGA